MPTCCIDNICRVVCDATFEPVLVCDEWRPLACNTRLLEVFQYREEAQVTCQPIRDFINRHFTPKEVQTNGVNRQVHIMELTYAIVSHSDMSEKMAIVKVKRWEFEARPYYTISVRDVHILKLLNKEANPQPLEDITLPQANCFDPVDEPQLESRLLREFSLLADAIPVMVWICGREGEIYYANKRVKEIWGCDVLSETWEECLHPDDWESFIPAWNNASKTLTPFKMECRYRKKYATPGPDEQYDWRWYIYQSIPIFDLNGDLKRWVLTAVDVHEWKCAEAEKQRLIASEKMAIEASKLKSAFLSTMSHEIRTPLFGIVGNTCLLSETDINAEQRSFLQSIDGSARLMMAVIQDILDFSRIEAGKLSLQPIPFSLKKLIKQVSKMVQIAADKKGLSFIMPPLSDDFHIVGDRLRIQQILTNLASNAVKFTHEGQVTLKATAHYTKPKVSLSITVQDTGIGMGPEVISKLFTPWTQADSSNRRIYGGSGLGLAISKALADMMGGFIQVNSEVGHGTTFRLELTLDKADENDVLDDSSPDNPTKMSKFEFYGFQEPTPDTLMSPVTVTNLDTVMSRPIIPSPEKESFPVKYKRKHQEFPIVEPKSGKRKLQNLNSKKLTIQSRSDSPSPANLPPGSKFKVLLAEDNPINQAILVRFLEKMRCLEFVLAVDGQQALNIYENHPAGYFDLILLDQSMPKMDGDQVCRAIRQVDTQQVIISVSANALLSDRTYFRQVGMNDHISKPVTFVNFRETVTKWLLTRAQPDTT